MLHKQKGFTIVELLIVIVIIGVLAAITIAAYNGMQQRAQEAQRLNDLTQLKKAILVARNNTNQTLYQIDGLPSTSTSLSMCLATSTEPKDRPKTDQCWTTYYSSLDKIAAASGINLDKYKNGDPRGNPYTILEMEGRMGCAWDRLGYFTGSGTINMGLVSIESYTPACTT